LLLIDIGGQKNRRDLGIWKIMDKSSKVEYPIDLNKAKKMEIEDNIVDAIFTSHTAEHLEPYRLKWFFKEIYRILKKGGILRIVVPDFGKALQKYIEGDYKWISRKGNPTKWKDLPKIPICYLQSWIYTPFSGHRVGFDGKFLTYLLKKSGFRKIKKCQYNICHKVFRGKDYGRYENNSLFYEAIK